MPFPFLKRKYKPSYSSLPEFESSSFPSVEEDEELESLGETPSSPVTVTVGAQDRYKKLLERGHQKPGWGRILASGLAEFGNQMRHKPASEQEMGGIHDAILGRKKYRDELMRASESAETERAQQAQQEREREHQAGEKIRQDTLTTNAQLRKEATEARERAAQESNETKIARAQLEQDTQLASPARGGWLRVIAGEPLPPNVERMTTSQGTEYWRKPQAERENWQPLPSYVIDFYKGKHELPMGPVQPNVYKQWENKYNQDQSTQRNTDDNVSATERAKALHTWTENDRERREKLREDDRERRERIRAEKEAKANSDRYQAALRTLESSFDLADKQLQNEIRGQLRKSKSPNGLPLTPDQVENKLWNDPSYQFVQRRQKLFDQFTDRKNQLASQYDPGRVYPRLDGTTGKPLADLPSNVQEAGQSDELPPAEIIASAKVGDRIVNPKTKIVYIKQPDGTVKRGQ